MLFTNSNSSGYENLVRRRLAQEGQNPDLFVAGDLVWGKRLEDSPIVEYRGFYYLQTIRMKEGRVEYFLPDGKPAPQILVEQVLPKKRNNQGLSDDNAVVVHCYALESIKSIRLLGEELPKPRRRLLGISKGK